MGSFLEVCGYLFLCSALSYLVPMCWMKLRGEQDLKKKYDAKWALVTGSSSGIGRAIAEKLASQGLNVCIVAYPDKVLDEAVEEMKKKYSDVEFRKFGVDLSKQEFMKDLAEKTKDIDIQLLFNNAGYIKTGFFTDNPVEAQLANHHVNATSIVQITHHYVKLMQQKHLKGCVTFTSSPAMYMPCPFSVLYGATKAFLTEFAQSLAPEIRSDGIDVTVVHPSPVASRFYDAAHKIDAINFFKSTATGPEVIADSLFSTIGRSVVRDQGYYPPVVRMITKIIDINLLADIITLTASSLPDFKAVKVKQN